VSAAALQRVVVRMLHDPALVAAVFGGGPVPGVSAEALAVLRATDRRAYGADPLRRSRALGPLVEEAPASAALAARGGADLGALDAFFSSPQYHACVMARGVLVEAFCVFLAPRAGAVAAVEGAAARARRRRPGPGPGLVRAAGVEAAEVPAGTVARFAALRERLGAAPVEALVGGGVSLVGLPLPGRGVEGLLVAGGGVSTAAPALVRLLAGLDAPRPAAAVAAGLAAAGLDAGEAAALLDGLVADGLLEQR
jgi:hypothetical protein